MKKAAFLVLCIIVYSACKQSNINREKTLNSLEAINKSLINSNALIEDRNISIAKVFDRMANDPRPAYNAKIWKPKVDSAKYFAENVTYYIEKLKSQIKEECDRKADGDMFKEKSDEIVERMFMSDRKGKELYYKLKQFRQSLLGLDPAIKSEFEKSLPIDSAIVTGANETIWTAQYFENTTAIAMLVVLTKLQNDVINSSALVLDFCFRKAPDNYDGYDEFSVFAGSNSQYFKSGQQLMIIAGVGAFSRAAKPKITIDGILLSSNAEGFIEYKTKVGKPGVYSKTVQISFTNPYGKEEIITKQIDYEVSSCGGVPRGK